MRLFEYADLRLFAVRIAAEQAERAVTDVVAAFADAELVFDIENGLRQIFGVFARRAKQMKGNTLRRFLADSGQPFAFLNEPGQRLRELRHLEQAGWKPQAAEHAAHFSLRFLIHLLR